MHLPIGPTVEERSPIGKQSLHEWSKSDSLAADQFRSWCGSTAKLWWMRSRS